MLIKSSELIGLPLDWAVARANQVLGLFRADIDLTTIHYFSPSTNWAQGGPLLDGQGISTARTDNGMWGSDYGPPSYQAGASGPTPLISAMRCYVVNVLGKEVEVPDELL